MAHTCDLLVKVSVSVEESSGVIAIRIIVKANVYDRSSL